MEDTIHQDTIIRGDTARTIAKHLSGCSEHYTVASSYTRTAHHAGSWNTLAFTLTCTTKSIGLAHTIWTNSPENGDKGFCCQLFDTALQVYNYFTDH